MTTPLLRLIATSLALHLYVTITTASRATEHSKEELFKHSAIKAFLVGNGR